MFIFMLFIYLCDFTEEINIFSPLGVPVKVTNVKEGKSKDSPLDIFSYLNEVG